MRSQNAPMIVSILSGKGGVGKSIITLNLAERTCSHGLRTLAIDLSSAGGNLHLLSNRTPRIGVEQYLSGKTSLSSSVVSIAPNCDLLGRTMTGPIEVFANAPLANQICDQLRNDATDYDLVIIDHGSGFSDISTNIAINSDCAMLVVIPELTSIADCYGLYKYLTEKNSNTDCRILINRTKSADDADYLSSRLTEMAKNFLRRSPSVAGAIFEDPLVGESVSAQTPLALLAGQSVALEQIGSIALGLSNELLSGREQAIDTASRSRFGSVTPQATINNIAATADIEE